MGRTYIRKTNNKSWSQEAMTKAVKKVKSGKMTLRQAADCYELPYSTLQRRTVSASIIKDCGRQPVMDTMAEKKFADRLIYLANRGFSITPKNVRKYAFDFAARHNLKHNFDTDAKMAGGEWFHRFMLRNKNITIIRKPESLSKAIISGMEKEEEKVKHFYKVLQKVIDDNDLQGRPECMYSQDDIDLPLNNYPSNIVQNGNVISTTSVERDKNVTILACMNATGHFIPPFVLFKYVPKQDDFTIGVPPGTAFYMTEKGEVTEKAFKAWLIHFNQYRIKGKVILILSGHLSHINLVVADLCEESDIEIILIPPHTSHVIQPLEVSFLEPLKSYYYQRATSWQYSNSGKGITKIFFGDLLTHAWNLSASVENASKGFEKTGIYPFNPPILSHKFVSHVATNDDINISATERSSISDSQTNLIINPQPTASTDTHANIGDVAITTTVRDKLRTRKKQISAKKTKVAKKSILRSTSENRNSIFKKGKKRKGKKNKTFYHEVN